MGIDYGGLSMNVLPEGHRCLGDGTLGFYDGTWRMRSSGHVYESGTWARPLRGLPPLVNLL